MDEQVKCMEEKYTPTNEKIEFQSGLTWRSLLAGVYAICIFAPAAIWLNLVTIGVTLIGAIQIITILIFVEFARFSGKRITQQEATVIFLITGMTSASQFIDMVYRLYFVHSPIAQMFGLTRHIPTWWAPSVDSPVWNLRTFWHPDWIVPIGIYACVHSIGTIGALVFASMAREIFIERERLPFPLQEINAEMILVITERKESRLAVLSGSAAVALIYGVFLYTIPTIAQAAGYSMRIIPIPWLDLTHHIELFMPGASFGIATDMMLVALGLILPPMVTISMLVASIFRFLIGNWITVKFGVTMWAERWTSGMSLSQIYAESTLYLWANPLIGISFAVGIVPIIFHLREVIDAFKVLSGRSRNIAERISGSPVPTKLFFSLFVGAGLSLILIYHTLVPDYPLWALFVWEYPLMFVMMLVTVRLLGETGITWNMPNMPQLLTLASGYQGVEGWFLPFASHPGLTWTGNFKLCQLTKTDILSFIKAYFIVWFIGLFMGVLYVSAFWSISPIPSALYPAPAVVWPVNAIFQALWITRPVQFWKPDWILYSFFTVSGLCAVIGFLHLPISSAGILGGLTTPIPSVVTIFLGTIVGKIIAYRLGKEEFNRHKFTLSAGIMLGEGIAITVGSAVALILTAIWAKPY